MNDKTKIDSAVSTTETPEERFLKSRWKNKTNEQLHADIARMEARLANWRATLQKYQDADERPVFTPPLEIFTEAIGQACAELEARKVVLPLRKGENK
jgi:hypothetical protein